MTHPYFVRLAVDLDPAGNPIGASVTQHHHSSGTTAIEHYTPGPFDSPSDVWVELQCRYLSLVGVQHRLW